MGDPGRRRCLEVAITASIGSALGGVAGKRTWCAGRALGANRILTNILVIVGGPLNYLVTPMGEFANQCFAPGTNRPVYRGNRAPSR